MVPTAVYINQVNLFLLFFFKRNITHAAARFYRVVLVNNHFFHAMQSRGSRGIRSRF